MLNGAPLLVPGRHMLEAPGLVKRAVVVLAPQEVAEGRELLAGYQEDYFRTLPFCVVAGGKERQDSVANALAAVEETDCYIAVHDGRVPLRDALFLNAPWLPLRCMAPPLLPFR